MFKVGDIVKCRKCEHWTPSAYGAKCTVIKVYKSGNIDVELLDTVDLRPYESKVLPPGFLGWRDEHQSYFEFVSAGGACHFESLL